MGLPQKSTVIISIDYKLYYKSCDHGNKVLKQSFTSEFKISRDADFKYFRKVFPTVQPCLVKSLILLDSSQQHQLYTVRLLHYTDMSITPFLTCWSSLSSSSS